MNRIAVIVTLLALAACDGVTDSETGGSSIETALVANDTWPYETVGTLEIVDVGYGDSDVPEWAVGLLVSEEDEFGVVIKIDGAVIADAGIDIDSGEQVRVWLESPTDEHGDKIYAVSKIQSK